MTAAPVLIPRRLAIALLAEAQRASDGQVTGLVGARDGTPLVLVPDPGAEAALAALGMAPWARYRSGAGEPDAAGGRQLLISVDTKGVLQLHCWETGRGEPVPCRLALQS